MSHKARCSAQNFGQSGLCGHRARGAKPISPCASHLTMQNYECHGMNPVIEGLLRILFPALHCVHSCKLPDG